MDCAIFVLWNGQHALMEDRPDLYPGADHYWVFPGGKVEPGEDPAAAMAREAWEEIGVEPVVFTRIEKEMWSRPFPGTKSYRAGPEGWRTHAFVVTDWTVNTHIPAYSLDTGAPLRWQDVEPIAAQDPDGHTCNVEIARALLDLVRTPAD